MNETLKNIRKILIQKLRKATSREEEQKIKREIDEIEEKITS
jgi:hypothetical protein